MFPIFTLYEVLLPMLTFFPYPKSFVHILIFFFILEISFVPNFEVFFLILKFFFHFINSFDSDLKFMFLYQCSCCRRSSLEIRNRSLTVFVREGVGGGRIFKMFPILNFFFSNFEVLFSILKFCSQF